jgi:hypothetical protein
LASAGETGTQRVIFAASTCDYVVGAVGLEPTTVGLKGHRSAS